MFYTIFGPLGYGIANSLSKITGNKVGFIRGAILQSFFSVVILGIYNYFFGTFAGNYFWILITIAFGIYGYFPLINFIKAISTGKIGVIIPVIDMNIIYPIILSAFFLNQKLSLLGILFMILILIGVGILSINFKELKESNIFKKESGVQFALVAAVLWGVGYFIWNYPVAQIGAVNTSIFVEAGVLIAALFHLFIIRKEKLFGTIPYEVLKIGFIIGICGSMGDLGVNLGIASVGVPVTMAVMGGRPAVGALAGYLVFKEKLTSKQILAIILVSVGVIGVSLTR